MPETFHAAKFPTGLPASAGSSSHGIFRVAKPRPNRFGIHSPNFHAYGTSKIPIPP